ncbi:uncharacterized protein LOC118344675 [Juglans regia]|uniref:RNA-directed DNA polymerase n=1 Tax=Juglans regia TaxID=51240 RepID=A0A6P9E2E2_JUGRE|nr:uncharacterized protein LOC118344675 [Juglans regia]
MDEEALVWYQEALEGGQFRDWDTFARSLLIRFGPTAYDDPMEALTCLKQTGSIAVFQAQFEALSNRLTGLSDVHKLSCFLSGLKDEIRLPIRMFNPVSLSAVYALSKIQEEYLASSKKSSKVWVDKISPMVGGSYSRGPYSGEGNNTKWQKPWGGTRKVSSIQMDEKRKKGLCCHCDEKWNPQHTCKNPRIYLMQVDEELSEAEKEPVVVEITEDEIGVAETSVEAPEISLAAITGTPTMSTMRLLGTLMGEPVVILVDSRSSHNFVESTLITKLKLPIDASSNLNVRVANGQSLRSGGACNEVRLKVQGIVFPPSLHLLNLAGYDIVFGIQWLVTLDTITWNFSKLLMGFTYGGKSVELKGLKLNPSVIKDGHKLLKTTTAKSRGILLQIMAQEVKEQKEEVLDPEFTKMLAELGGVFKEPEGLPPPIKYDHKIVLKEGTQPIANRPYRYPYYQKTEIEKIVAELLKSGVVRPSMSPFSSPVLLVRKADGSWRLCVDYRALNKETVKAKFPIPVIDELLDELAGSVMFSKLDLRSGYHQVRVAVDDIPKTAFQTHEGHYEFLSRRKHLNHLKQVLSLLEHNSLFAKRSKSRFVVGEIEYLGHVINAMGAKKAFEELKQAVSQPPMLRLPDFNSPFTIECDACGTGLGAVLMQAGQPISYMNKGLKGKALLLSTYEKELLALVTAVQKWRTYLLGQTFIIKTDQEALKYLLEQRMGTKMQQKWVAKLMGYHFSIEYKKGKENKVADALSRRMEGLSKGECAAILYFPTPSWSVASDRDPIFLSNLWKAIFTAQESSLDFSSAYHLQSDGQTEAVNKCVEAYLCCYASSKPKVWVHWLPMAEWWYNTTYHTTTKMTPYQAVYGHPPPTLLSYILGTVTNDAANQFLNNRDQVINVLKQNLTEAQQRMKHYADKQRTEREFTKGDWVYLKL